MKSIAYRELISTQYVGEEAFSTTSFTAFKAFTDTSTKGSDLVWVQRSDCTEFTNAETLESHVTHEKELPAAMIKSAILTAGKTQRVSLTSPSFGPSMHGSDSISKGVFDVQLAAVQIDAVKVAQAVVCSMLKRFPPRALTDFLAIIHPSWWLGKVQAMRTLAGQELIQAQTNLRAEFSDCAKVS
jgi:hypothetical protein